MSLVKSNMRFIQENDALLQLLQQCDEIIDTMNDVICVTYRIELYRRYKCTYTQYTEGIFVFHILYYSKKVLYMHIQ